MFKSLPPCLKRLPLLAGPGHDLEMAVLVLGYRGATLHPIAAIDVTDAEVVVDRGMVDMTAYNAIRFVTPRFRNQRLLKVADVVDGVLDFQLRPL